MKQLKLINPENASEEEVKSYNTREAARAIVIDKDGNIALLYVSKSNYYKLPGGGIDEGENKNSALLRECKEEIGCEVEVLSEIGSIVEYRKIQNLKQTSYCYLAKVRGDKGTPSFTESEIGAGFKQVWLSYDNALDAMRGGKPPHTEGKEYIKPRDTTFLEEAKELILKCI